MIFILNITLILVTEGAQVAIVARIEELLQEAAAAIREKTGTEPLGGGLGSEAARRCEFLPGRTASSAQSGGGAILNVIAIGGKTPGASSLPTSVSRAAGLALTKVNIDGGTSAVL